MAKRDRVVGLLHASRAGDEKAWTRFSRSSTLVEAWQFVQTLPMDQWKEYVVRRLIELYRAWGRPADAARFEAVLREAGIMDITGR